MLSSVKLPWIPEPLTVNNKLKRRKALVQREDSLIKPRKSQNRISGFSTESVPVEPEPSRRFNLLFTVELRLWNPG